MLYAVSVETRRAFGRARMVRRINVFVDARDGVEAAYLARLRFRHRPEARSLVVRGVRGVPLRLPPPPEDAPKRDPSPSPQAKRRRRGARRRKCKSTATRVNA